MLSLRVSFRDTRGRYDSVGKMMASGIAGIRSSLGLSRLRGCIPCILELSIRNLASAEDESRNCLRVVAGAAMNDCFIAIPFGYLDIAGFAVSAEYY